MTTDWKVRGCVLAVIFFRRFVVGLCGVDFIFERAKINSFSFETDAGPPALHVLCPVNTFIFRARRPFEFAPVPDVLVGRCRAQIRLAVVQAVMVDVVAAHAVRDIDNQVVHIGVSSRLFFAVGQGADGVPCVHTFLCVPFIPAQAFIIFRVDDGEFPPCQRDFSKGIAVADSPVQKYQEKDGAFQPLRNVDNNSYDRPSSLEWISGLVK